MSAMLTSNRVDSIRRKLDELARLDVDRRLFGSREPDGHGYVQRARLDTQQLSDLETSFGVELPGELRIFLGEVHGGGAGPGYGLSVDADPALLSRRSRPFPFDDAAAQRVIAARLDGTDRWASLDMPDDAAEEDDWPPGPGFIPIAHHGCGIFDVVVTTGAQRGLVWCCDMTWCPVFDAEGRPVGILDWYERWLDRSLEEVG